MSTTIASVFILLASQLFPLIGIEIGSEELTNLVSTIVAIGTGIYLWYKRVKVGDVKVSGARK